MGGRGGGVCASGEEQYGRSKRNTSPGQQECKEEDEGSWQKGAQLKGEGDGSVTAGEINTSSDMFSSELCSNDRSEFEMLSHLSNKPKNRHIITIKNFKY